MAHLFLHFDIGKRMATCNTVSLIQKGGFDIINVPTTAQLLCEKWKHSSYPKGVKFLCMHHLNDANLKSFLGVAADKVVSLSYLIEQRDGVDVNEHKIPGKHYHKKLLSDLAHTIFRYVNAIKTPSA